MDTRDVLLVAIVEMVPGHAEAGQRYEDAVLELLERHGGTLERRTRSSDGTAEVHLIRFTNRARYQAFMIDPDRTAHRVHAGDAVPMTRVIEVHDV
jgi:hypothetical protein